MQSILTNPQLNKLVIAAGPNGEFDAIWYVLGHIMFVICQTLLGG
jgi:hypothetical protein